jgi:hypothetical protein
MPTLRSHTHLQATQANAQTKACKRVCLPNRTRTLQTRHDRPLTERRAATNSTYKKLAVQWLNEALCFVSSFVVADSFRLRNRQLLVAAKRCASLLRTPENRQL